MLITVIVRYSDTARVVFIALHFFHTLHSNPRRQHNMVWGLHHQVSHGWWRTRRDVVVVVIATHGYRQFNFMNALQVAVPVHRQCTYFVCTQGALAPPLLRRLVKNKRGDGGGDGERPRSRQSGVDDSRGDRGNLKTGG